MNENNGYVQLVIRCIHTQFADYQVRISVTDKRNLLAFSLENMVKSSMVVTCNDSKECFPDI